MLPVAATLPFAAAAFRPEGPEPPQPPSAARPSLRSPTFASPGAWASQAQKGPRRVGSRTLRQRGPRAPLPLPPAGDESLDPLPVRLVSPLSSFVAGNSLAGSNFLLCKYPVAHEF